MPPENGGNQSSLGRCTQQRERRWHRIIDGTGGGDFKTVTPSNQASELTAQRLFQIDEIARITGVPPTMLFGLDHATWGNVEQLDLQFRQFACAAGAMLTLLCCSRRGMPCRRMASWRISVWDSLAIN